MHKSIALRGFTWSRSGVILESNGPYLHRFVGLRDGCDFNGLARRGLASRRGLATSSNIKDAAKPRTTRRVPFSDPEGAIKIIEEDGGVILKDFTTPELVQKVNRDVHPYITAPNDNRAEFFLPPETTRCTRLFGRSETARENWMQQPQLLQILNHFLTTKSKLYDANEAEEYTTHPILSSSLTFNIGPGAKEQFLHRDDSLWQYKHTNQQQTGYRLGSDIAIGILVPGVKTSIENGATMFIPGSHLWDDSNLGTRQEAVSAEMNVGESFLWLSSTIHGGGANTTQSARPAHGFFFCRSYLRPEENPYVWWKKEEVEKWSLGAQKQAGYVMDTMLLGHCDFTNPLDMFRASGQGDQTP